MDKNYRLLHGLAWWPDEQPSDEIKRQVEEKLEGMDWEVDVVLTHTAPLKYEPTEVFLPMINQSTVDKSTEQWLDSIEEQLYYDRWYCGHYHTAKKIDKIQSRFEWVRDYAEIHDNKRKIVLMHYPVFCYNGQFRRGADGTPLTYMLHGHIHKSEDQVLVDRFGTETRATMRKSAHQETAQPVPCQMINCFCMYSDYTPLTLEEWVECDQRRRNKADCG